MATRYARPAPAAKAALVQRAEQPTIAAQIAVHEAAILELRQQQRAELLATIAVVVGARDFTAGELWRHAEHVSAELRALFVEHGLTSTRTLAKRLEHLEGRTLNGLRLEKIGADHHVGNMWRVILDSPSDPCAPIGRGL